MTFAAVEAAAGKSRHELAGAIGTARRRMVRDHGVEFVNVRGVGYRALADAGHADAGQRDISRVGRITRRRRKRMELADVTRLSADERVLHYGTSAQLALIGDAASLRATKKSTTWSGAPTTSASRSSASRSRSCSTCGRRKFEPPPMS